MIRATLQMTLVPIAACGLTACASLRSEPAEPLPEPLLPPSGRVIAEPPVQSEGSLWVHGRSDSLWHDPVASQVHDIVFVNIAEEATATQTAETQIERSADLDYGIPNLLGRENEWNTINDDDPTDGVDPTHLVRANSSNDFEGDAETLRRGSLTARVSAQVVEVFPNGNMRIHGTQVVTVNGENQLLTVEGIARPFDIEADNSIDSSRLAEARIEYTGRGVMSDVQRPGWGSRLLSWVWPF
jgi:flagellar L-ring protein precursor FlgH